MTTTKLPRQFWPLAICWIAGIAISLAAGGRISRSGGSAASLLPTTKEIVARYDEALGGREAMLRHTSCTMRGILEIHGEKGSILLPFVFYAGAPFHRRDEFTLPNQAGESLSGFDGENAWSFDPRNGAQIDTGDQRESVKRDADFYYPINELSWFKSMETVGVEDFEGQSCYRLHGINNWNKSNDQFYDRQSGLLAGYEFDSAWRGGAGLTHDIFLDYRKFDGVLVPMKQVVKIRSKSGGDWSVQNVLTYTSVTFNDVEPGIFTPPQAVRDLLAKNKAVPKSGSGSI
ncbi:MAG: hypothetical protein ACRD4K_00760 [Candidatus Acidiferrales bacterium]